MCLCVVYCQLNGVAHTDNYPIPQAGSLIDCFGEAQDLTWGCWQLSMAKKTWRLSAFTTPFGLFQWKEMLFSLSGASAAFPRLWTTFSVFQTKKKVQTLVHLTGYHQKLIQNQSSISLSLTKLIKKHAPNCIERITGWNKAFLMIK